jgi:hypothetical protein
MKIRDPNNCVSIDEAMERANWGWNGDHNGYFSSGVFNSNLVPYYKSNGTKSSEFVEESDQDYNYQYDIQMPPYIRR